MVLIDKLCAQGTGKTHIAVMLIQSILAKPVPENSPHSVCSLCSSCRRKKPSASEQIIAFVVPTVPLVHQQGTYISRETDAKVREYSGEMQG